MTEFVACYSQCRAFLLEILGDEKYCDIIQWQGDREFKFLEPKMVAALWGAQKNNTNMNYDKLTRALRLYSCAGNKIVKVKEKRHVYKFVCDITSMVGKNAKELSNML